MGMTEAPSVEGRLMALHWPDSGDEGTVMVDLTRPQAATAEIEDAGGVTHRVDVAVAWDADYLVGKQVRTTSGDDGIGLESTE